jgi:DNA-binding beta-propeller fold protein YncE
MRRFFICFVLSAALAACSQIGSGISPSSPSANGRKANATLIIKVPNRRKRVKRARYISPATTALRYQIDGGAPVTVALMVSNPSCTNGATGLTCSVSFVTNPGSHTLTFTALDASGRALSADSVSQTILAGRANSIAVTLGGIAASIAVSPVGDPQVSGTQASPGFSIYGNGAANFTVVARDADGDAIIGPGAPSVTLGSPAPSDVNVATPDPASTSSAWTLASTYTGATDPGVSLATTLNLTATPVPNSGGSTVSTAVALSLFDPWLYVTNNGITTLYAFDEQGNAKSPSGAFSGLNVPQGITYDPDNGLIYVASNSGNTILAFTRTGSSQSLTGNGGSPFPGLTHPTNVAYDANNQTLYVADNNSVLAFDAEGNTVTLTGNGGSPFPNVNGAQTALVDPHNHRIYVANYNTSSVTAYDEEGNQELTTGSPFSGLSNPRGIAFDPVNDDIYVVNNSGSTPVSVFDENGNAVSVSGTWTGVTNGSWNTYDPHNGLIYITVSGHVLAFDDQGNAVTLAQSVSTSSPQCVLVLP